jgi:hypothetical protein
MEYRILLAKDIRLQNIRYSPLKRSSNKNRYSLISYFNDEDGELQSLIFQAKQMNVFELSVNEKSLYSISFEANDSLKKFIKSFEQKVQNDIVLFKSKHKDHTSNISDSADTLHAAELENSGSFGQEDPNDSKDPKDVICIKSDVIEPPVDKTPKVNEIIQSDGTSESTTQNEDQQIYGKESFTSFQKKNVLLSNESRKSSTQKSNSIQSYNFRSSLTKESKTNIFKCRIGRLSNLVVFDQYRKLYDDEQDIIKMLKNPSILAIPIIECVGLWISNENEYGLSWVCHHIKVIQNSTLFKRYLFVSDDSDEEQEFLSENNNKNNFAISQ